MLGRFFKRKNREETNFTPNSAITNTILNVVGERSIPSMPSAAQLAFKIASDPNAEAHQFIDVFEQDEALAARVLKIANSVYYSRGQSCHSLEQAVAVIGLSELRCLLCANSLTEIFPSRHPLRTYLWQHDLATAIAAKNICPRISNIDSDLAFLAGLMHDIGKLLLLQQAQSRYEQIIKKVFETGRSFKDLEVEEFAFDHHELGSLIASKWNFSKELTEAIYLHHQTPTTKKNCNLSEVVFLADLYAHALSLAGGKSSGAYSNIARQELTELSIRSNLPLNELNDLVKNSYDQEIQNYSQIKT